MVKTLTKLYRCLIRSKLDYSCFIYGAARKSCLRELKTIHHLGLCIALRAFTTSPIESLYIEANEPPLSLRRYKLALQYYIKLISCPQNSAYNCIIEIRYKNLFENKEKAIKPFNLRIQTLLNEIKINPKIIHNTILPKTALWTINQPMIKLDLTKFSKTKTHSITFQKNFLNIQNNFRDHHPIYTDGSKQGMKVGCAAVFQNQELLKRLPNESSIYSAEAIATDLTMNIIANHNSFLSLRFFGLLSSSLSFPQRFGRYVFRPSSGVCRTREPSRNSELRPLLKPRGSPVLIPFAITGYKC